MEVSLNKVSGDLYFGSDPKYQLIASHCNTRSGTGNLLGKGTFKWFSRDGKEDWLGAPGVDFEDVLLSRKQLTQMKVKLKVSFNGFNSVLFGFLNEKDRQEFVTFVAECKSGGTVVSTTTGATQQPPQQNVTSQPAQKVKKQEEEGDVKDIKPASTSNTGSEPGKKKKEQPPPLFVQRHAELRQLYNAVVASGIISEEEFLVAQTGEEDQSGDKGHHHLLDVEAQKLGQTSVYEVLNRLVDPKTRILRDMPEEDRADIFLQVPLFAKLYQKRVKTRNDEYVFWSAVFERVMFFANSSMFTGEKTGGMSVVDVDDDDDDDDTDEEDVAQQQKHNRAVIFENADLNLVNELLDGQQAPGFGTKRENEKIERGLLLSAADPKSNVDKAAVRVLTSGGGSGGDGAKVIESTKQAEMAIKTLSQWNRRSSLVADKEFRVEHAIPDDRGGASGILGHSRLTDLQAEGNEDVEADRDVALFQGGPEAGSDGVLGIPETAIVPLRFVAEIDSKGTGEEHVKNNSTSSSKADVDDTCAFSPSCFSCPVVVSISPNVTTNSNSLNRSIDVEALHAASSGNPFSHLVVDPSKKKKETVSSESSPSAPLLHDMSTQLTVAALCQQYWLSRNRKRKTEFIEKMRTCINTTVISAEENSNPQKGLALPRQLGRVVNRCFEHFEKTITSCAAAKGSGMVAAPGDRILGVSGLKHSNSTEVGEDAPQPKRRRKQ